MKDGILIDIDLEKYIELCLAANPDGYLPDGDCMKRHYKLDVEGVSLSRNKVVLKFTNEQDMIWFKLKYL